MGIFKKEIVIKAGVSAKTGLIEMTAEMAEAKKGGKNHFEQAVLSGESDDELFSFAFANDELMVKLNGNSASFDADEIPTFLLECTNKRNSSMQRFTKEELLAKWTGNDGFQKRPSMGMSVPVEVNGTSYNMGVYANTILIPEGWGTSLTVKLTPTKPAGAEVARLPA